MLMEHSVGPEFCFHQGTTPDGIGSRRFLRAARLLHELRVRQAIAPELVGWRDQNQQLNCYWIKQPETADELDRAIEILHTQELGCH